MLGYGMPTITTHLGRVEAHKTMARVILKAQDKGPGPHPHVINCFVSLLQPSSCAQWFYLSLPILYLPPRKGCFG